MTEGAQLKSFIENQRISKTTIAKDLGISRPTLYQYFDSRMLEEETKEKFEQYFGTKIFLHGAVEARNEIVHGVVGKKGTQFITTNYDELLQKYITLLENNLIEREQGITNRQLFDELQEIKTSLKTISTTLSSGKESAPVNLNPVEGEQDVSGNKYLNTAGAKKGG